ncbi:MAG: DsbA family oxidoreductase [Pedobacter sp.]|nr:MAG: DsbA family oxidoreductase [Pedobacter sp.]
MQIAVWSDIACPFCYIGKRHLEKALSELSFGPEIEVEYHAYMLNKDYQNPNEEDIFNYLSREKQLSREQVHQMTTQVKTYAAAAGLDINFDINIPANTFQAHRLIALANQFSLQASMKERLFKAHFEEGLNIAKKDVLRSLALEVGITAESLNEFFEDDRFKSEVTQDLYQAQLMGISGVPFFLLNQKYAISGAQPIEAFKQAISAAYEEWQAESR